LLSYLKIITKTQKNVCQHASLWEGGSYSRRLTWALCGSPPQAASLASAERCALKGEHKEIKSSLRYA